MICRGFLDYKNTNDRFKLICDRSNRLCLQCLLESKNQCRPAEKSEKSSNSIFYALLDLYRLTNDSTEDRRNNRSKGFQH